MGILVKWTVWLVALQGNCCVYCSATWPAEGISVCYCMLQSHKISPEDKVTQYVMMSAMVMPVYRFSICVHVLNWCFVVSTSRIKSVYTIQLILGSTSVQQTYAAAKQVENKNYYIMYMVRNNKINKYKWQICKELNAPIACN